jgi:hypothetical protein
MLAIVVSAYDPPQNPELRLGVLFLALPQTFIAGEEAQVLSAHNKGELGLAVSRIPL